MENTQQKIKVARATPEEVAAITVETIAKLESATVGQLQATLVAIAEAFIGSTAVCPDQQTKYGLAMVFISHTLDGNTSAISLQSSNPLKAMAPITGTTN